MCTVYQALFSILVVQFHAQASFAHHSCMFTFVANLQLTSSKITTMELFTLIYGVSTPTASIQTPNKPRMRALQQAKLNSWMQIFWHAGASWTHMVHSLDNLSPQPGLAACPERPLPTNRYWIGCWKPALKQLINLPNTILLRLFCIELFFLHGRKGKIHGLKN